MTVRKSWKLPAPKASTTLDDNKYIARLNMFKLYVEICMHWREELNNVHLLRSTFNKCLRLQKSNTTHLWIKNTYAAWGRKHMCLLDELIHGKDVGSLVLFWIQIQNSTVSSWSWGSFQIISMQVYGINGPGKRYVNIIDFFSSAKEGSWLHFLSEVVVTDLFIVKCKKLFGLNRAQPDQVLTFWILPLGRPPSQ